MESTILILFSILVSIFIAISLRLLTKPKLKFPPGSTGLPLIGETFHLLLSGPEDFIRQRMKKYSGEIFITSLLGEETAVVCGPEGNKFLHFSPNDSLVHWLPPMLSKFILWSGGSANQALAKSRHFIHEILRRGNAARDYIPIMDSMARQHLITEWEPFDEVKVYPLANKFALSLACRLLLGLEDPVRVQKFSDSFSYAMSGLYSLPVNLPGTTYNGALKEIKSLKEQFLKIIQEKKQQWLNTTTSNSILENKVITRDGGNYNMDILSKMLLEPNTKSKPELEIAFDIVTLLIPIHESTSSATTFALKYVAELPHIHDMVYKEMMEIAKTKSPEELLNWEDIQKMKYSWNVVCESLRLTPPGLGSFREVKKNLNFAGFTIPKGWKMLWSPFTTNKDPRYFPDPEKFDPARHAGDGPAPGIHIPFSMGPRKCPGQDYAKFVILVYMYNVVKRFRVQKLNPDEKIIYLGGPVPANGLPVRLQPLLKNI